MLLFPSQPPLQQEILLCERPHGALFSMQTWHFRVSLQQGPECCTLALGFSWHLWVICPSLTCMREPGWPGCVSKAITPQKVKVAQIQEKHLFLVVKVFWVMLAQFQKSEQGIVSVIRGINLTSVTNPSHPFLILSGFMVTFQHGQILNPCKQQILIVSFLALPKPSLTFYKLLPGEEEYLSPDHIMVIVSIYPQLSSLSLGRFKPRSCHSDQQTLHHHFMS